MTPKHPTKRVVLLHPISLSTRITRELSEKPIYMPKTYILFALPRLSLLKYSFIRLTLIGVMADTVIAATILGISTSRKLSEK